ncbi:hypothetical protein NLY34_30730 [Mesorhizobium sp. C374B]|uniref:hypothetical protein n=1 Tax=unclassified Mesorhizobium TaxID=325217 RepID=UPI0004CE8350|nr:MULTISPECIES: hypothetical protein [unclassified Mesorhizobium]WJI81055.1 hypothetical protein NLY34_30730 [Mesorhizobium sp. C374B]
MKLTAKSAELRIDKGDGIAISGETPGSAQSVHEDFVLVSIREVFWCRRCPISYFGKGDIDLQIGRRREASPSMSDF